MSKLQAGGRDGRLALQHETPSFTFETELAITAAARCALGFLHECGEGVRSKHTNVSMIALS